MFIFILFFESKIIMSQPLDLELAKLLKKYDNTTAVNNIDLKIKAGSYCCLLGPSGCGKTSTFE